MSKTQQNPQPVSDGLSDPSSGERETKRLGDIAHIKTASRNNQDKVELGYPFNRSTSRQFGFAVRHHNPAATHGSVRGRKWRFYIVELYFGAVQARRVPFWRAISSSVISFFSPTRAVVPLVRLNGYPRSLSDWPHGGGEGVLERVSGVTIGCMNPCCHRLFDWATRCHQHDHM